MTSAPGAIGPQNQAGVTSLQNKFQADDKQVLGPGNRAAEIARRKALLADNQQSLSDAAARARSLNAQKAQDVQKGLGGNLDTTVAILLGSSILFEQIVRNSGEYVAFTADQLYAAAQPYLIALQNYNSYLG